MLKGWKEKEKKTNIYYMEDTLKDTIFISNIAIRDVSIHF